MCVQALAGLAPLFSAIGTGVSVVGTLVGAKAQANAAAAAAQQSENNKIIAQRNAEDSRNRGVIAQQDQQLKTRARLGMQRNALSERSIEVSSGSALEILGDTAMTGKLDEMTTRANYEREAIGYETQAYNFSADAAQQRMAARNATTAGIFGALGTAFDGMASYGNKYGNTYGMAL